MVMSNNNNNIVNGGRQQQQQQGANTAMTMATGGLSPNAGGIQKKGPWSASEDALLTEYVREHGEGNWNAVQKHTGLQRCGKSCRLRWANHLRPNLKKGTFSLDEERLIIDLHSKLGNKWARISSYLPGRTDNEIKNYWNTRVKRRIRQGLPLYPNEGQRQPSPSPPPPLHPPTLPLSLPKTSPPTLTLFNNVSFSSPIFPPFNQRPPHLLASHPLKRCSTNSYMGTNPIFPPTQVGPVQKMEIEGFSPVGFGYEPARKLETESDFSFGNFELPSYQCIGHKNNNNSNMNGSCIKVGNQVKVDPYVGRANNTGLLDDLLQEAQHKAGLKKEREDYGGLWDVSSSENSSSGHKKEELEEQKMKFDNQDLSNILELIPSLVEVPSWSTNDGGAESSAAQSAAVSTDDNYYGFNDDLMPQPPSFAAEETTNYDDHVDGNWNLGSYSWNNLPKFC